MKNLFDRYGRYLALLLYIVMVLVNALANILPINGVQTGEVSDEYANLFTPAGITFSIWGLIYLLLAMYSVYQLGIWNKKQIKDRNKLLQDINKYFVLSSVLNISWIFAWHYQVVWLSVLLIVGMLLCLIKIADLINADMQKNSFSLLECIFIRLPFSIYFGWITVAVIANIAVLLVSVGWDGFGVADNIWTVIVILVGAIIGSWRMLKDKNLPYGLVFIWAYLGIWIKHVSVNGFNGQYQDVINTLVLCVLGFLFLEIFIFYKIVKRKG